MNSRQSQFARTFVANLLGETETTIADAMLEEVFNAISRTEEIHSTRRDQWGNWDAPLLEAGRRGETEIAALDRRIAPHRRSSSEPLWPGQRPLALCLTHDLDAVSEFHIPLRRMVRTLRAALAEPRGRRQAVAGLTRSFAAAAIRRMGRAGRGDPIWHFEDWLRVERRYGFRSTWYAFAPRLPKPHRWDTPYDYREPVVFDGKRTRVDQMLQAIADAGCEIGLHASYHAAAQECVFVEEKRALETALHRPVVSVRHHYLHYDAGCTPQIHAAAGIGCDSTQGFNRGVGFRAGTSFPYWCWDHARNRELPVLEIPMIVMDAALFERQSQVLAPEEALRRGVALMDEVQAVGGCLTLNWHPHYINHPHWWPVYGELLAEAQRRNAWGCTAGELCAWWARRQQRIVPPPAEVACPGPDLQPDRKV
jgi:peptidoglycan/xylan/chitin deacetylase (PgdA/CDA1 family)